MFFNKFTSVTDLLWLKTGTVTTKLSGTWVKGKDWTSACYQFSEAILVQATTFDSNHFYFNIY
jgi:hypothetical protein